MGMIQFSGPRVASLQSYLPKAIYEAYNSLFWVKPLTVIENILKICIF